MKSDRKTSLIIPLTFATLSLSLAWLGWSKPVSPKSQPELRVATRYFIEPEYLDPTSYRDAAEYDLVSYLYSPLVEFNNRGQLVSGISDKFYWQGSDLIFEIRKNAVSSKGEPITAQDVLFSMKRHNILMPGHASQFFSEVCEGKKINKIDDPCPGMTVDGNKFTLHFKTKKPIYLDIFSSVDFAIVPRASVDKETLKVVDRFNTTGPYALVEANKNDSFLRLKAREDHWLWKENIPQKVLIKTILDKDRKEASSEVVDGLFRAGQFDLIPTFLGGRAFAARIEDEKLKGYSVFKSLPISTYILFFSERARAEYSTAERIRIGEIFREAYYQVGDWNSARSPRRTNEFFPLASDGSLTDAQKEKYRNILKDSEKTKLHRTPVLHVITSYMQNVVNAINKTHGQLSYLNDDSYRFPPDKSFHQRFDGFFSLITASTVESADSIFWLKEMNWMPYSAEENDQWIKLFLEAESKTTRISMLKNLHFDMLAKGLVAPTKAQEYAAVARGPWKLKLSNLFSTTPLWHIEYEP